MHSLVMIGTAKTTLTPRTFYEDVAEDEAVVDDENVVEDENNASVNSPSGFQAQRDTFTLHRRPPSDTRGSPFRDERLASGL